MTGGLRALARGYRLPGAADPPPAPDHDTGEAEAMAEHHAAPPSPDLPRPDPLTAGLLRGFHAHRAPPFREDRP